MKNLIKRVIKNQDIITSTNYLSLILNDENTKLLQTVLDILAGNFSLDVLDYYWYNLSSGEVAFLNLYSRFYNLDVQNKEYLIILYRDKQARI